MNSCPDNNFSPSTEELPLVSVVIPERNEREYIAECLRAIQTQSYPDSLIEILIADGMSDDGTREIIAEFIQQDSRIKMLDNPQKIVPTGMNIMLRQVRGDVVVRVDGHCIIDRDYILNCVNHLIHGKNVAVGGPMRTIESGEFGKAISLATSSKFGVGNSSFRTESGETKFVDTVPFPAYLKSLILEVGYYDEELVRNQDDEYNYRIRSFGHPILLADDVRSVYYARSSYKKLWKQYFQYGVYKIRVLQKHPKQMSLRQFVPFFFVVGLSITLLLSVTTTWGWVAFSALVGVYLTLSLIFSMKLSSRHGRELLFKLPIAFAILHISYGLGFIVGLFRFWNRWGDKVGKVPSV